MTHTLRRIQQRGATLIVVALGMGMALAAMMALDIGNLVWQKRELQKIADLAALAGARQPVQEACTNSASANAFRMAKENGLRVAKDELTIVSGKWEPIAGESPENFFSSSEVPASEMNACYVRVQRTVPYLFFLSTSSRSRVLSAEATALVSATPMAGLAVRSTLAAVNGGALNVLLSALLGSQVQLDAAGWQGIANLNVNLLKVADHLIELNAGVGNYEELLKTDVRLLQLLEAMVTAVEPGQAAEISAGIQGLNRLASLGLGKIDVRLGDLINLKNVEPGTALNLGVNALDLIQGSLQLAAKNNAINLGLGIPGLATVKLKVIEPAQLAIVGNPYNENTTIEVRTAQVRLWVAVETSNTIVGSVLNAVIGLVVDLLKFVLSLLVDVEVLPEFRLGNTLRLDVLVDAARGYARVEDVDCTRDSMDVYVDKAAVDLYVGQLPGNSLGERELQAFGDAIPNVQPITVIDIGSRVCGVLGLICGPRTEGSQGNIKLGGHLQVAAQNAVKNFSGEQLNRFEEAIELEDARKHYEVLPKNLKSISGLLQGAGLIQINLKNGSATGAQTKDLVNTLLNQVLTPLLKILDPLAPLLDGLLSALGVSLNQMEVAPYLQCSSAAELVY